jgi:hypothetical protein
MEDDIEMESKEISLCIPGSVPSVNFVSGAEPSD